MADSLSSQAFSPPSERENHQGDSVEISTSSNDRRIHTNRRDTSRPYDYRDWIVEQAKALSAKKGAELTGLTPRGFQEIRAGKSKPSSEALTKWCQNDIGMAVAYAQHIGVLLPGDCEQTEALMKAMQAFMRRGQ